MRVDDLPFELPKPAQPRREVMSAVDGLGQVLELGEARHANSTAHSWSEAVVHSKEQEYDMMAGPLGMSA